MYTISWGKGLPELYFMVSIMFLLYITSQNVLELFLFNYHKIEMECEKGLQT